MNIILASNSPRRKELLKKIFAKFEIVVSNIKEDYPQNLSCNQIPIYLAIKKAENVYGKNLDSLIIAADTIVCIQNKILGKPKNKSEARKMLQLLNNKVHLVISGVCLIYKDKRISFSEETYVKFKDISEKQIEKYINSEEPYDKAGGYGIQGKAYDFVENIVGDYDNVVGLPVNKIKEKLNELGIDPKNLF